MRCSTLEGRVSIEIEVVVVVVDGQRPIGGGTEQKADAPHDAEVPVGPLVPRVAPEGVEQEAHHEQRTDPLQDARPRLDCLDDNPATIDSP